MEHERHDFDADDLAAIWLKAQHRRIEDVCSWFIRIFKKKRQLKTDTRPDHHGGLFRSLTLQGRLPLGSQKGRRFKGGRSGR
jgi:hypothetical protein